MICLKKAMETGGMSVNTIFVLMKGTPQRSTVMLMYRRANLRYFVGITSGFAQSTLLSAANVPLALLFLCFKQRVFLLILMQSFM
jgi:hypothetical protein